MSLTKVNYIDNSTIITAKNLNDIQDNIIELQNRIPLDVEYGGTGATSTEMARRNLEITPENIGAMNMELLQVNASPGSDFARQVLTIDDISVYDLLLIETKSTPVILKAEPSNTGVIVRNTVTGNVAVINNRAVSITSATQITIADNLQCPVSSTTITTKNGESIPLRIYGIKGVSE